MQLINRTHRNRKWGTEYKTLRHNRRIINIKNLRMTLPKGGREPVAPVPKSATVLYRILLHFIGLQRYSMPVV